MSDARWLVTRSTWRSILRFFLRHNRRPTKVIHERLWREERPDSHLAPFGIEKSLICRAQRYRLDQGVVLIHPHLTIGLGTGTELVTVTEQGRRIAIRRPRQRAET